MNDNIDKNEIRKAIDRLQTEHPCGIAYDPTAFVNMEAVNTIKKCVDKIARRMMEDTEINVICEFAKLYLEGVRPTIVPKQEWIPCSERLPETDKKVLVNLHNTYGKDVILMASHIGYHERTSEDYGWQEFEGDTEYDEENDCFWIPECWCESNYVEDNANWIIDECEGTITHWMPLPEPYKEGDPDARR